MKKHLPILLIVLAVIMTACSTSSTGTPIGSTSSDLPIASQLAVGILKLAGTDQAVTTDQAGDLVLYWETYKQLSQSDTAAQAEYDGLISQIEETLTADQMQAITDMSITQQDVFASIQGVTVTTSTSSTSTSSAGGGGMPAGGPPSDGAPLDGGMGGDMGGVAPAASTDQTQSPQANASTGTIAGVPTTLIEAVIQFLQQIIAA